MARARTSGTDGVADGAAGGAVVLRRGGGASRARPVDAAKGNGLLLGMLVPLLLLVLPACAIVASWQPGFTARARDYAAAVDCSAVAGPHDDCLTRRDVALLRRVDRRVGTDATGSLLRIADDRGATTTLLIADDHGLLRAPLGPTTHGTLVQWRGVDTAVETPAGAVTLDNNPIHERDRARAALALVGAIALVVVLLFCWAVREAVRAARADA